MNPVTDPAILEQLNGTALKPVTDQALLAQLNGTSEQQNQPMLDQALAATAKYSGIGARALYKGVAGLADAIPGAINIANTISDKVTGETTPKMPMPVSELMDKYLNAINVPSPETTGQRLASDVISGAAGGGALGMQGLISGAAGMGSAGSARELGAGEFGQTVAGLAGGGLAAKAMSPSAPLVTAEDVKNLSRAAYQDAEQKGGNLSPEFTNKFIEKAQESLPRSEAGGIIAGKDPASDLVERIKTLQDRPLTLSDAQDIDTSLGDLVDSHLDMGNPTPTGRKILEIQTNFRNMIDNPEAGHILGGKEGFQAWKDAKDLWSRSAKLRDIEKIVTRASLMQNPATGIKNGFRTLLLNDKRMRGFTFKEKQLIRQAAESGVISDTLRSVLGSRLIAGLMGAGGGGLSGAAMAQVGSMAARGLAERGALRPVAKLTKEVTKNIKKGK